MTRPPEAAAAPAAAPGAQGSAPAPSSAISARALTKRFGDVLALDALDLDVPAGSIFGLLGPNGAGKTTTLRLLLGLAHATSGTATVAGVDIRRSGDTGALGRRIGYLDQAPRYYGWMRGRELLELAGRLHGLRGSALRARVAEVLELVGIADAAGRRIGGYSGGMRQRLGIGAAVVGRPQVLFLDEPVSSLDPEGRRDVLEIVERLRGTATVVLSTHVLTDVERVCDRVAILDRGRLVVESPLADLIGRYAPPTYRIEVAGDGDDARLAADAARLAGVLAGTEGVTDARAAGPVVTVRVADPDAASTRLLGALVAAGTPIDVLARVRPTLEDVFLDLV
ncbi:MAG: ABC transporter ATP-binding protein, partial [Chloroflexi bacterium]|nr:ABC transporter ATP-binding protein [Chloroflexota bacterium]